MNRLQSPFKLPFSRAFLLLAVPILIYGVGVWAMSLSIRVAETPGKVLTASAMENPYSPANLMSETVTLEPSKTKSITLPANSTVLEGSLPSFATLTGDQLNLKPARQDIGNYTIILRPTQLPADSRQIIRVQVTAPKIDVAALKAEIAAYLGSRAPDFGIYIEDLLTKETVVINDKEFPPASIAKVPVAVLILRDIDAGKYTLDTTITVQDKFKHSRSDAIGALPAGTKLPIRRYLEEMIKVSSNTAWYHLREHLGGIWAEPNGVNARTKAELNANPFFEDPHLARPSKVGRVFADFYRRLTLSDKSATYLIDLLKSATPSLRTGIPAGIGTNASAASKVGFLFGGKDNTYADAGIVFSPSTDYVLVILNAKAPPFPSGSAQIKEISKIVYKYLIR